MRPVAAEVVGQTGIPVYAQVGTEYAQKYGGVEFDTFARISEKNHAHSTLNPLASYSERFTLDEIKNDVMIAYPNTRPMYSANCDGAAADVLVAGEKLREICHHLRGEAGDRQIPGARSAWPT